MGKLLRAVGWGAIAIGVLIGILRVLGMSWWRVPADDPLMGASIAPSLAPGDLVLLWRGTVAFGDLVRCDDPEAPGRYVIGRILGEAGDQLDIEDPEITINNRRTVQEHSCSPSRFRIADPSTGADVDLHCGVEAAVNKKHLRATQTGRSARAMRKVTVGEGQFYLISDNRAFPMDSRDYGGLPKASCKETVFFRIMGTKGLGDGETRFTVIQ